MDLGTLLALLAEYNDNWPRYKEQLDQLNATFDKLRSHRPPAIMFWLMSFFYSGWMRMTLFGLATAIWGWMIWRQYQCLRLAKKIRRDWEHDLLIHDMIAGHIVVHRLKRGN